MSYSTNIDIFLRKNRWVLGLLLTLSIIFWLSRQHVNNDVSWLTEVGQRFLHGGVYLNDFFETNPPMAFIIYLPIIFLKKSLSINQSLAFSLYYTTLTFTILHLISQCLTPYKLKKTSVYLFLFHVGLWFFFIPLFQLGQRDLLSLLLVMPHVLFCFSKLNSPLQLSNRNRILIVFFGCIGYLIKPFFLIVWLSTLGILYLQTKNIKKSIFLANGMSLCLAICCYLVFMLLFTPEYISQILPILLQTYYKVFTPYRLNLLLADPHIVFRSMCLAVCGFFLATQSTEQGITIIFPLLSLALGYTLSYFTQGIGLIYHSTPALLCNLLLLLMSALLSQKYKQVTTLFIILYLTINMFVLKGHESNRHYADTHISALKQVIAKTPTEATINILICDNSMTYPTVYEANAIHPSTLQSLFLVCIANRKTNKKPFYILSQLLRYDLVRFKPEYLIMLSDKDKKKKTEQTLLHQLFSKGLSQSLWQQYHFIQTVGRYALYKKK